MRKIMAVSNKTLIFTHEYKFNPQVFYIIKGKKTLIK